MAEYAPHQQRVVEELDQLEDRTDKLGLFFDTDVFDGLPQDEQDRMSIQYKIMRAYGEVLRSRINHFSG